MTSIGVLPKTDAAPASAPNAPHHDLGDFLVGVSPFVHVLARLHDEEADGLVGSLLQDGGQEALVDPADALLSHDHGDAVEEALESGGGTSLVVDEFHLDGLHGGDGEDRLADPRTQAAQETAGGAQGAVLVDCVFFLVSRKCRIWESKKKKESHVSSQ
jgi:hypothetical protein